MSRSQFHSIKLFILRHAWLNLWDKHMTTGRINQVTVLSGYCRAHSQKTPRDVVHCTRTWQEPHTTSCTRGCKPGRVDCKTGNVQRFTLALGEQGDSLVIFVKSHCVHHWWRRQWGELSSMQPPKGLTASTLVHGLPKAYTWCELSSIQPQAQPRRE